MKDVLDALRFSYQRMDHVLLHAELDDQDRARLIESRDTVADVVRHMMGGVAVKFERTGVSVDFLEDSVSAGEAQLFLQMPDKHRRDG